jgi:hypothetical protein
MTSRWGPLGWMTLHSISVCYPDEPTVIDKQLLNEFMNSFSLTITCSICNDHFSKMFRTYKTSIPTWNNSKQDLFVAICRMHNTVNSRLNKPIPKNVGECLEILKNATKYSPQPEFRKKYIEYLATQWQRYSVVFPNVSLMKKINDEYWSNKELAYNDVKLDLTIDTVTYPNQPVPQKDIFTKLSLRNIKWSV